MGTVTRVLANAATLSCFSLPVPSVSSCSASGNRLKKAKQRRAAGQSADAHAQGGVDGLPVFAGCVGDGAGAGGGPGADAAAVSAGPGAELFDGQARPGRVV